MTGRALGLLAGGLAMGAGQGMAEVGKQMREERLKELDRQFTAGENQKTRDATATNLQTQIGATADLAEKKQAFDSDQLGAGREDARAKVASDAEQKDLDRKAQVALEQLRQKGQRGLLSNTAEIVAADGSVYRAVQDDAGKVTAQPVLDPEGKHIKKAVTATARTVKVGSKTGKLYAEGHEGPGDSEEEVVSMQSTAAVAYAKALKNDETVRVLGGMKDATANRAIDAKLTIATMGDDVKRLAIDAANGREDARLKLKEKLGGDENALKQALADAKNLSDADRTRIMAASGEKRAEIAAGAAGAGKKAELSEGDRARIRREARKQATEEADAKAGYFSTDSSDFKATGGSRTAWINDRVEKIIAEKEGTGASPAAADAGKPETGSLRTNSDKGGGAPAAAGKLPDGITPAQAIASAKESIKNGKDKAWIANKLKSWGIDPSVLD